MHPEITLVFLTVLASTGQGLFIMTVLFDALFVRAGTAPAGFITTGTLFAIFFQLGGMAASTFHLGNAKKGWKAILKWNNSWLTREVITLSAFVGLAFLYLILHLMGATDSHRLFIAALAVIASIGFFISSSMVYASISFIREWANVYTPLNFIMLGITSGVAYGSWILYISRHGYDISTLMHGITVALIALGSISFILKYMTNRYNANTYAAIDTKKALGINDPTIKLIDMGTSYSHYNTKEYFYPINASKLSLIRKAMYAATFVIPLVMWGYTYMHPNALLHFVASHIMLLGIFIERWLFFVQSNHLQNLYYGNFRTTDAKNPLLTEAPKGDPVPH